MSLYLEKAVGLSTVDAERSIGYSSSRNLKGGGELIRPQADSGAPANKDLNNNATEWASRRRGAGTAAPANKKET